MIKKMLDNNISSLLNILITFKLAYKEENGVIIIGDIRDLINNIDLLEECVRKQKRLPMNVELKQRLFGNIYKVYSCPSCGFEFSEKMGCNFCSNCGQKIWK